jgi:hypothetical protein
MQTTGSSEITVNIYHTTRRYLPEEGNVHSHCRESLKYEGESVNRLQMEEKQLQGT